MVMYVGAAYSLKFKKKWYDKPTPGQLTATLSLLDPLPQSFSQRHPGVECYFQIVNSYKKMCMYVYIPIGTEAVLTRCFLTYVPGDYYCPRLGRLFFTSLMCSMCVQSYVQFNAI